MSYSKGEFLYNEKNGVIQPKQKDDVQEKTRLQPPVKLQPSWEENNLPEDELNFKNLTMEDASLQLNAPPDRLKLVFIIFLIHGIGVLMPWNMFINAFKYFVDHKFHKDYIGFQFPHNANFMQYITFASQVPNVLFNYLNIFVQLKGSLTTRIVWSIIIEVIVFLLTIILAMVDTSSWPYGFFAITIISIIIINAANGVWQNTVYGMAAKMPPKYTGVVILGNNISGTFTAIASIVSKLYLNLRMAAIYYFISALFILLISFDTYFALPLNKYYRHFELKEKKESERRLISSSGIKERIPYFTIFKQALPQLFNVFFLFFCTLACFPSITSGISSKDPDFFIDEKLYVDIMCFLTFNVTAMLGSLLPNFFIWPGPKYLWIPVVLRILYIPFFLLCNYHVPTKVRSLPVYIENDWVYWIISITFGITSGYFSSLGMMYVPGCVEPRHAPTAGMLGGAALITGIFAGIIISFAWPWFISSVGY